jgi:hypothetical protein
MRISTFYRTLSKLVGLLAIGGLALLPSRQPSAFSQAPAADTTVYAEGLASGWADWSWDTSVNLASTAAAHSGNLSVAATYTAQYGGLRLHANAALGSASYSAVRFWIHGGTAGGQAIQFKVITADDQNWDNFAAVTPQAGSWTQVTVALASLGSPPTIADLVWQDAGGAQATFYVDDVTLVAAQLPGAYAPLAVNENANVDGYISNQFTWYDSAGKPRSAALVKNDQKDPLQRYGGYLRRYTYSMGATTRVVDGTGVNGHPGFGFTVNHYDDGTQNFPDTDSYFYLGTYSAVLRGRHHAIHQFKWRLPMGDALVDTTVQWFFATGRDHPIWSVTFDSSPTGPNAVKADTRAPYGDLHWDGGGDNDVAGVGWGDHYKFRSLDSPVTMQSGWDYSQPNTIPYVIEWMNNPDAEMGLVQTQTYLQHDAGGFEFYPNWGKTDADGPMPVDYNWPYQLNQYELPFTTTSKRMAWGANFGAVGQTSYLAYGDDRNLVGYPYQSYSLFIVLDKHSLNPVADQVSEIETVQKTSLSASVGSVVTSGPAGIGRTDSVTYAPAGYNQIYSTWNVRANASNQATFNLNVAQGTLSNPIVVIQNFTGATPATILINGATKTADVDYFASLDSANHQLWLTLKGSFSGSTSVSVAGGPSVIKSTRYLPVVCANC